MMAVHTSNVDPFPHQISAVYESMLPRQPLLFVLADAPGVSNAPVLVSVYPCCCEVTHPNENTLWSYPISTEAIYSSLRTEVSFYRDVGVTFLLSKANDSG